jgi:uncharacterized protein YlzI (FlbEa/FlbD family)
MILLHEIRGEPFHLNDDLIEVIEATPDTLPSLKGGRRLVVPESPDEVVDAIRIFGASGPASAGRPVVNRGGSLIAFPGSAATIGSDRRTLRRYRPRSVIRIAVPKPSRRCGWSSRSRRSASRRPGEPWPSPSSPPATFLR